MTAVVSQTTASELDIEVGSPIKVQSGTNIAELKIIAPMIGRANGNSSSQTLAGPVIANSMLGTTYAYRARDIYDPTTLQITVVRLPKASLSAGEFSTEHCIQLFLTEVARDQSRFFAVPVEKALEAGELHLQQVR